jgi:hypothetical protein
VPVLLISFTSFTWSMALSGISLTSIAEPVIGPFAKAIGLDPRQTALMAGAEAVATGIEFVHGMLFTQLGAKIAQLIEGIIELVAAGMAPGLTPTLRQELTWIAFHSISRIADPSPETLARLGRDIQAFVAAVRAGDVRGIQAAMLRTPQEAQGALAQVANILGARPVAGAPPAPTAGAAVAAAASSPFPRRVGLVQVAASTGPVRQPVELIGRSR